MQLISRTAVALIDFYRRHLSHRKGYCCAHNWARKQGTCSAYGRKAYAEHGPLTATRLLLARLRECREVYAAAVARMDAGQYQAHWKARGFLLSPHQAWIEKWRQRRLPARR